jgi:DNA-directed RNA polymerase subunit RPC12/RpoP
MERDQPAAPFHPFDEFAMRIPRRTRQPWVLAAVLVFAGAFGAAPGQEPDKQYAKEFHHVFNGEPNPQDLRKLNADKENFIKFEPDGLRLTLPAGNPGGRQPTGVMTGFGVKGDFEITSAYEILHEPEPADTDGQTRLTLTAILDKPKLYEHLGNLHRRVVKEGTQYFAWLGLGPAQGGVRKTKTAPTTAKSGRLRLVRAGGDLSYLTADTDEAQFKLLATFPLGPEDLKQVNIVAGTGGEKAAIDVRVRELHIRAAALLRPAPKVAEELVAPQAEYAQEYYYSFKDKPPRSPAAAGWEFHGPDARECVKFERDGLRLTLPAGWDGERPGTGLQSKFGVKGDFEMTMSYEILKGPGPGESPKAGTRLTLTIVRDTVHKGTKNSEVATISRTFGNKGENNFVNWMRRRNAGDTDNAIQAKVYPMPTKSGRLRLVRSGPDLYYLKADGKDDQFKAFSKFSFGDEDLWRVELVGSTGGAPATLDARILDIHIRAKELPGAPATDPAPVVAVAVDGGAEPPPDRSWLWTALLVAFGVVVVLGGVAGVSALRRRRRLAVAANGPVISVAAPVLVSVTCAGCGKKLKAKEELAGRKVKCPHCGKSVLIPLAEATAADEES